ncbi:lamin tail domain-containing protein [uncultured Methanolobus sp.]|uniref:lamin tail domain-containing protein n=1 Tax=uncultured Methanolobus sp. TaxID=218300 RepID=UPI0029C8571A|nr:lamin tail domain-containing protein [uncultured Methanolobus sp.]
MSASTVTAVVNDMKGDYDSDGDVDFDDFVEFAAAYNKAQGEQGYDEIFDFDGDLDVDFDDFVEFAGVYGKTSDETVRIGAFNIQIFGVTKADNPSVMTVLTDIIRTYDVIAIQEIRDISQTALPELVDLVNSDGSQYDYVVSERLGRTTSKEQYAYVYNTHTVTINEAHTYPEPDGTDPFHRQPYIASIKAMDGNYDATLIVIHTDPDEATEEINALDDVVEYAKEVYPGEQDFVIMGDFNADGSYFDEDSTCDICGSEYTWVIDNSQDTTVASSSNTYDRIVLTDTSDYIDSGVFRFDTEYGLSLTEASAVSDHYPVYAEFQIDQDNDAISPSVYVPIEEPDSPIPSESIQIVGLSLVDEWVKIQNTGSSPVSLDGWIIVDEGEKHTYTFPSFTLITGATVTVHTGYGTNTATDLYWGTNYVWNNDGDYARLYDSDGNLVDTRVG